MRHLQGMGVRHVEFSAGSHLPATASDEQISEARAARRQRRAEGHRSGRQPLLATIMPPTGAVFEFAKKLGIRTITANPQPDAETFASLDKLVAEYDIRIAIHNHGPGTLYDKLDDVVTGDQRPRPADRRLRRLRPLSCRAAKTRSDCVLTLADRVYGVHLKDQAEVGKKSENVVIGKGHLDVVALFKALRRIKFPPTERSRSNTKPIPTTRSTT